MQGLVGQRCRWQCSLVACLTLAPLLAAAAAASSAPFVVVPPAVPAMTRTPEAAPIGLMNRVLEPLPPDAPVPPADVRNLEGVWTNGEPYMFRIRTTMTGATIPFNAEGARVVTARVEADNAGRPLANASTSCRPTGHYSQPWSYARKMVWRPDRYLAEYNCERQVGDQAGDSAYGLERESR